MKQGFKTFLVIWVGQLLSVLGSAFTSFGIGVWTFERTHSASLFSIVVISFTLPAVLLSPVAGALADRWDRRTAMIVSNVGAGFSSLVLVLLAISGQLQLWELYPLIALSSAFGTLMWPAMTASISVLVPKEQFTRANGLLQGTEAFAMLLGPILGAVIYTSFGLGALVGLDVLSFVIAIGSLCFVRIPRPEKSRPDEHLLKDAVFGFGYIRKRRGLLGLLIFFLMINLVCGFLNVLYVPFILTLFNAKQLAVLQSAMGIGALLGTVIISAWGGPRRQVYGVLGFAASGGICIGLFGFRMGVLLYAIAGAAFMLWMPMVNACSQAIWQAKVEPDLQGRVFAVRRMIGWSTAPIAALLAGALADRVFVPGMKTHGSLASVFGFLGTGADAGYRVMFLLIGLCTCVISALAYASSSVRNVETYLPAATVKLDNELSFELDEESVMAEV